MTDSNYILITVDALRADHLNVYGYDRCVTSPNVDALAGEGLVFNSAYACGVPTFLSFPSVFCSIYPSITMRNMYLPRHIPTFVELLKQAGFYTAAFVDINPFCSSLLGYDRGFDLFHDFFTDLHTMTGRLKRLKARGSTIWHCNKLQKPKKNSAQLIQEAITFIKSTHGKFFIWIHLMDTHWPYFPPENVDKATKKKIINLKNTFQPVPGQQQYDEEARVILESMYDASVRKADAELKDLFDFLRAEDLWENTLIFVTSDHGEELLERGAVDHQENTFQEVTRVPLIVKTPDSDGPKVTDEMTSLLDISTTILENENISIPPKYEGCSMFHNDREYCISETIVPTLNKLAKGKGPKYMFKMPFKDFVYSIRDKNYTVLYDKDDQYKIFDRNSDAKEEVELSKGNSKTDELLTQLKEHQRHRAEVFSDATERGKIRNRVRKLKNY